MSDWGKFYETMNKLNDTRKKHINCAKCGGRGVYHLAEKDGYSISAQCDCLREATILRKQLIELATSLGLATEDLKLYLTPVRREV